jgi:hypothetical protein
MFTDRPGESTRGADTLPAEIRVSAHPRCSTLVSIRRLARPVSHYHGHLTEAFRMDWGLTDVPVVQVNVTVTFPGRIRAWGIHRFTVDRPVRGDRIALHSLL